MKKNYNLLALLIPFVIAVLSCLPGCYGNEKATNQIENKCPYEGAECPNAQKVMQDYQIQIYNDTVWIYDGERLVGSYISNWNNQMDSIIIEDNL